MSSAKELFYTGHSGSSPWELGILLSVVWACMGVSRAVNSESVFLNMLIIVVPLCLSVTLLSEYGMLLIAGLVATGLLVNGVRPSVRQVPVLPRHVLSH